MRRTMETLKNFKTKEKRRYLDINGSFYTIVSFSQKIFGQLIIIKHINKQKLTYTLSIKIIYILCLMSTLSKMGAEIRKDVTFNYEYSLHETGSSNSFILVIRLLRRFSDCHFIKRPHTHSYHVSRS